MMGPNGVNQMSRRASSRGFFESWPVLSTVLMVWTCHSMNPLDLGKWAEDVE